MSPSLARHSFLTSMSDSSRLGGKSAILVFVLVLAAGVIESQLTQVSSVRGIGSDVHNLILPQHAQATLKYRQPYFLMYVL
jgi:hypothetical protein